MPSLSPDDILDLREPTNGFLCSLSENTYGIEFLSFTISDYDTKNIIFEVDRDHPPPMDIDFANFNEDMIRKINYSFSEDVLRLPLIQTTLVFSIGPQPIENFRMIERHYFRGELIKCFDFDFGFVIPGSQNTWDAVYAVPPLEDDLIQEMVNHPFDTQSDSFYFVGDKLVMHNKASYKYIPEDAAQEKKSYEDKYGSKGSKKKSSKKGAKSKGYNDDDDFDDDYADGKVSEKKKTKSSKKKKYDDDEGWSKESDYY